MKFLNNLARVGKKKSQREKFIKTAALNDLNKVRNICHNICKGNFNVSPTIRKKLFRYRKQIRHLANKKKLKTSRGLKKYLIQSGGFIAYLAPLFIQLLSSLGSRLLR